MPGFFSLLYFVHLHLSSLEKILLYCSAGRKNGGLVSPAKYLSRPKLASCELLTHRIPEGSKSSALGMDK